MADNEKMEKTQADSKASKKDAKPEKRSKPGIFARIKQWFKETKAELKKVQWPTWKQTMNNTLIVLAFCVVVGICIFAFDALTGALFTALIDLTH